MMKRCNERQSQTPEAVEGIGDAMAKIAANIAYGIPNDVSMLLSGKALGRSDENPDGFPKTIQGKEGWGKRG